MALVSQIFWIRVLISAMRFFALLSSRRLAASCFFLSAVSMILYSNAYAALLSLYHRHIAEKPLIAAFLLYGGKFSAFPLTGRPGRL